LVDLRRLCSVPAVLGPMCVGCVCFIDCEGFDICRIKNRWKTFVVWTLSMDSLIKNIRRFLILTLTCRDDRDKTKQYVVVRSLNILGSPILQLRCQFENPIVTILGSDFICLSIKFLSLVRIPSTQGGQECIQIIFNRLIIFWTTLILSQG
jgi:hypothetical protein